MTTWLLIILRFSDTAPVVPPVQFQTLAECRAAITELRAAAKEIGYSNRALVAACVKQTLPKDLP